MCQAPTDLFFLNGIPLRVTGSCVEVRVGGNWNEDVGEVAVTREGLHVTLSSNAQNLIRESYDGNPLKVSYVVHQPCCGDCNCYSCGCGCGSFGDCAPTRVYPVATHQILYGRSDADPALRGTAACIVDSLLCGIPSQITWACCVPKVNIDASDVTYQYGK